MTKDDRLYAPFDIGMDEHPKIIGLSDAAFRAMFEGVLYSRRRMSDGFLDARIVLRKWGQEVADELSSNDPDRPSWIPVENGWQIRDFEKHHPLRAEIEEKRAKVSESKSIAGKRSGEVRRAKAEQNANTTEQTSNETGTKTNPETETETETISTSNEVEKPPNEVRGDVETLCELLADLIEDNGSKRPAVTSVWRDSARLLLDKDKREWASAHRLIEWCQQDGFWKSNILSMPKFREKYDQLRLAANRQQEERRTKPTPAERARATLALATDIDQLELNA